MANVLGEKINVVRKGKMGTKGIKKLISRYLKKKKVITTHDEAGKPIKTMVMHRYAFCKERPKY